ncbi:Facilitated trehalose transporter Tret1, partial [Geodia barretti]
MFPQFSCVLYVIGYLMISYAHFASTAFTFISLLQTGRFISGGSMGWSSTAFAVYIGEISSSSLRGLFGILMTGSTMVGVTLTFALSSIDGFYYYHISLVAVGIVAVFEVLMVWTPETPRSLLSRGYVKEAKKVLKWLRGSEYEEEFQEIKHLVIESRTNKKQPWRSMLKRNSLVPFLYVVVVISV